MTQEIQRIVNEVITGKGLNAVSNITESTHLRNDLELDSFDLAELTVRVEDELGVDIFADGIVNTIGEIIAVVRKNRL